MGKIENKDYYNQAQAFHDDVYVSKRLEANRYFVIIIGLLIALISAGAALAVLVPLKERVPYLVENNSRTGEVKVVEPMERGEFKATPLNVEKYVADYLIYRESFDHHNVEDYFNKVQLMSSREVNKEYIDFMTNDPGSPYTTFRESEYIKIQISNMNHLAEGAVIVDVLTTEYKTGIAPKRKLWAIVLEFEWLGEPLDTPKGYEYFNPPGFTVTRYSKDQKLIND